MLFKKNTLVLLCLLAAAAGRAQVVINEFSAANWQQFPDNYGKPEDWLELFNNGVSTIDLGGWWLSDKVATPRKWAIPAGTVLGAGEFLTVFCSKRDEAKGGFLHTNFSLTQTKGKDAVVLANPSGAIVGSFTLKKTQVHQSWARAMDGSAVWKICTAPTPGASNDGSPQFAGFAARPDMNLAAGFYTGPQSIEITSTSPADVIRFTIDGTEPTAASAIYSAPIAITKTTVVKARAFSANAGLLPSFIQFNTYFIDENQFSLVVVSVAADDLLTLANGQKDLKPVGTIEYFGMDKLRHARSYGELNSHGQDSWINNQRRLDWVCRDEMGYSGALNEKLFGYSDRKEYQRIILRASGDDNFPGNFLPEHNGCAHIRDEYAQGLAKIGGLKLDVRSAERMVVFLNGKYWGVYGLREYPDDSDYTDFYYSQDKWHIQMLETWGWTWAQYGGEQAFKDWRDLRNFIMHNDMGDPANYAKVKDELNVTSMCDYFISGLNYVASDWINYNTAWWRGTDPAGNHKKWGYMLWDFDAVFDYYINYSGVPNTQANAQPCDINAISNYVQNDFWQGQQTDTCTWDVSSGDSVLTCDHLDGKHDVLFLKLQNESPEFQQLYYSRKADLENTVFSCQNMLHVLDSMAAVISPEMKRHGQRWGGTQALWAANVKKLRDFIEARCGLFDEGMVDCYSLSGPYPLTVNVAPAGAGDIDFNTLNLKNFPWTGNYYGGMFQKMQAKAKPGFQFSHWGVGKASSNIGPSPADVDATLDFTEADTLTAYFTPTSATGEAKGEAIGLAVYPTLSRDGNCTAEFTLPTGGAVGFRLVSALGEVVSEKTGLAGAAGRNTVRLDFSEKSLPSGVYFVEISAGARRGLSKLTVVK